LKHFVCHPLLKKDRSPTVDPFIKKLEFFQMNNFASIISLSPSPKWIKYMNK